MDELQRVELALRNADAAGDVEAATRLAQHYRTLQNKGSSFDLGKAFKTGFAQTGNTVDRYVSQLGLAPLSYINPDEADKGYKAMEERISSRDNWANPSKTELTFPEKVASAVTNLPGMVLSMPMSPATTGAQAIQAGETLPKAMGAAAIDSAGNALGMGLGPLGKTVGAKIVTGFTANAGQEVATKAAIQGLMDTEHGKKTFQPTVEDATVAGIVGGAFAPFIKNKQDREAKTKTKDVGNNLSNLAKAKAEGKTTSPEGATIPYAEFEQNLAFAKRAREMEQQARETPIALPDRSVDPTLPRIDESLILRGAEREQPLPEILDPELVASQRLAPAKEELRSANDFVPPVEPVAKPQNTITPEPYQPGSGKYASPGRGEAPARPDTLPPVDSLAMRHDVPTIDFPLKVEHLSNDPMAQQVLRELDQRRWEVSQQEIEKAKGGKRAAEVAEAQRQNEARIAQLEQIARDNGWTGYQKDSKGFFGFGKETLAPIQKTDPFPTYDGSGVIKLGNGGFIDLEGLGINPEMFKQGVRKVLEITAKGANKGYRLISEGHGNFIAIEVVDKDGNHAGGTVMSLRDLGVKPEMNVLSASMTKTDESHKGQHLMADVYQRIADEGNHIVPAKAQTEAGQGMWKSFERTGVSKNKLISPGNKQRGSISFKKTGLSIVDRILAKKQETPETQHGKNVDLVEATKALPESIKNAYNGIDIPPADPKAFVEYAKDWIDNLSTDLTRGERIRGETTTAGANMLAKATKNPAVRYTYGAIDMAYKNASDLASTYAQPLSQGLLRLSKEEKMQVAQARALGEGKFEWTYDELIGSGMSERAAKLVVDSYVASRKAHEIANQARLEAGGKEIPYRPGHMAGTFLGSFRTLVKDSNGVVKYVVSHDNKWLHDRAVKAVQEKFPTSQFTYEKLPNEYKPGKFSRDAEAAFKIMLDRMAEDDPVTAAMRDAYVDWKAKIAENYLGQSQHFKGKQKEAVGGAQGLKIGKSLYQNALDGLKAEIRYLENSFMWAEMEKAGNNIQKMMVEANLYDKKPETVNYINSYLENAKGWRQNSLGEFSETLQKLLGKDFLGPLAMGRNVLPEASSWVRAALNAKMLGGPNVSFLAINMLQVLNPLAETRSVSKLVGNSDFTTKAFSKYFEGFNKIRKSEDPFWVEANEWASAKKVSTSAIDIDTKDIGRLPGMHTVDKAWNGPRRYVEEATRRAVFGGFLNIFKDHYSKHEAFQMAAAATERSMGDYRTFEKAMMFESGGFMGKNAGFLRTYVANAFSQMGMYMKSGEKTNAALLLGTTLLGSGIAGAIGVQQVDMLIDAWNAVFASSTGKRLPSVKEALLKNGVPNWAAFGPISAMTGMDTSGRMGFGQVAPSTGLDLFMPGAGDLAKTAGAAFDWATSPTSETKAKKFAYEATPNSLKAIPEQAFYTDNGMPRSPNTGNLTGFKRGDFDQIVRYLNIKSLAESKHNIKEGEIKLSEAELTQFRGKVMEKWWTKYRDASTSFAKGKESQKAIEMYTKLGGDPNAIIRNMEEKVFNHYLTPEQKAFMSNNPYSIQRRLEYGP